VKHTRCVAPSSQQGIIDGVSDQYKAVGQNGMDKSSALRQKLGDTIRVLTHLKAGGLGSQAADELASLLTGLQTDLENMERVLEAQAEERAFSVPLPQ